MLKKSILVAILCFLAMVQTINATTVTDTMVLRLCSESLMGDPGISAATKQFYGRTHILRLSSQDSGLIFIQPGYPTVCPVDIIYHFITRDKSNGIADSVLGYDNIDSIIQNTYGSGIDVLTKHVGSACSVDAITYYDTTRTLLYYSQSAGLFAKIKILTFNLGTGTRPFFIGSQDTVKVDTVSPYLELAYTYETDGGRFVENEAEYPNNDSLVLINVYPNPFNPVTNISISPVLVNPVFAVYDISGRLVKKVAFIRGVAGINFEGLPGGLYVLNGKASGMHFSRKLLYIR